VYRHLHAHLAVLGGLVRLEDLTSLGVAHEMITEIRDSLLHKIVLSSGRTTCGEFLGIDGRRRGCPSPTLV
jgi:hypothetical protein